MRNETRDSIILTIGTGATALLSLVYLSLAGRIIDETRFADFTAATAFIAMCTLAMGPINGTVAKFTAQFAARDELGKVVALYRELSKRVIRYGVIALVIGLLLLFPLTDILKLSSVWPLLLAYATVFVTLPLGVFRGVLRGVQRYALLKLNTLMESAIRLAVGGVLLWMFATVSAGLCAFVISLAFMVWVSRIQIRRILGDRSPVAVDGAAIKRFSIPIFVMMLTSAAFQNVDMLFVKSQFGELQAGAFGAAYGLARSISALFTPFNIMLLPLMTTLHERKSAAAGAFLRVCVYFLILVSVPVVVFAIWPQQIITAMYHDKHADAANMLLWITLTRVAGYMGHLLGLTFLAREDYRFLWIYVPSLAIQLVAMYAFSSTLSSLIFTVLIVQTAAMILLALLLAASRKRPVLVA